MIPSWLIQWDSIGGIFHINSTIAIYYWCHVAGNLRISSLCYMSVKQNFAKWYLNLCGSEKWYWKCINISMTFIYLFNHIKTAIMKFVKV